MSLFKIAWRSIQKRGLASALTALSMALGVLLVVSVLLIMGIVTESFRSNSSLGYNIILGKKGSEFQLVMNTVYYLYKPVENVPYAFYEEFLEGDQRLDGEDGEYAKLTEFIIPLCLGDYYKGYRVIGTIPAMFEDFVYDSSTGRKYEFEAPGRNFKTWTPEHGFFEAVVGYRVAKETGLKVGDEFSPTHGPDGETHDTFFVTGILKQTGTPNDKAVFVNMEGFFLLEGHAKPVEELAGMSREVPGVDVPEAWDQSVSRLSPERQLLEPLPLPEREVTAMLLRTVSPLVSPGLRNSINEGDIAQAVMPIQVIYSLYQMFVSPMQSVLLVITIMVCIVSGVSILVSIYNSMSDRKREIAVMRSLGAGRRVVMTIVLLESVILALLGGALGWLAGHLLIGGVASAYIDDATGVQIGVLDFAPKVELLKWIGGSSNWGVSSELLLIPGLVILAIVVGFLPAVAAYRTDVAKSLSSAN